MWRGVKMPKTVDVNVNKALQLFNENKSFREIGEELGVSANTIKRRLENIGIESNRFKRFSKSELYDLYVTKGMTTQEIGDKYNCSKQAINTALRKHDIPLRTSGHRVREDSDVRALYGTYKYTSRDRGIAFNLSVNRFKKLILSNCHYCSSPPYSHYKNKCYDLKYNGIDRIDNNLGYEDNNTVTCCWMCNKMKNSLTHEDFVNQIIKIYNEYAHKLL